MSKDYKDRGMIKWQPFDSVISSKKVVNNIYKKRQKVEQPILSEDQLIELNDKLNEAYYSKNKIKISYYFSGSIIIKETKIKKINLIKKQVVLSDNTLIYYKQIVNIKII